MSHKNNPEKMSFWGSSSFANLLSCLAFIVSFFILYKTELAKGKIKVAFPTRIAIASANEIQVQDNHSDKIFLSFSIYNTDINLKTVKEIILTVTDKMGEEMEFIAEAQFDKLKNIELSRLQLRDNENYSLITAFSIPSKTHYIANHLFFYRCDEGWHSSKEERKRLGCEDKPKVFQVEPGMKYKGRIHVNAFETTSQDVCFTFIVLEEPQSKVLDFNQIIEETSCH